MSMQPPVTATGAPATVPAYKIKRSIPGEGLVWLSGMGLAIGLCMVAVLMSVIVWNGVSVFWPKRVIEFSYIDKTAGGDGAKKEMHVAGSIVKTQQKAASDGKAAVDEIQIYTGNKDVYNLGFRYLDQAAITAEKQPDDIMVIERMTGGNAIGTPVALIPKGEAEISPKESNFVTTLDRLVAEMADQRAKINRLEKGEIGGISDHIKKLELKLKVLPPDDSRVAGIKAEVAKLNADSNDLMTQAKALHQREGDNVLKIRLVSGEERKIAIGDVISYYFPNLLGPVDRCTHMAGAFANFLWQNPRESNTEGGIFPAIFGTFVMTLLMSALVVPFGVMGAIYLREYAKQGPIVRAVRIAVNNLAGVPSIVFGVFGLGFFVYVCGGTIDQLFYSADLPNPTFGTGGLLWAAMTLALMTVPVVIVATEEAVVAVPRGMREGSLACGASKWQTIQHIILPASVPGILTGLILAMARGAGEVAPLMLVGVVKLAPSLPLDLNANATVPFVHLNQKFMHLGFHIFDLGFQSPDSEAARPMVYATTLLLIMLVLVLNLGAIMLRDRLRRRFATSAF
jgi:phosphate transport system permease protein